jgi:hypothetical protein
MLALLDHCGQDVEVVVDVEQGDTTTPVMSAQGALRSWRNSPRAAGSRREPRPDIEGLFEVGDASIDITELTGGRWLADGDDPVYGLVFTIADGVSLTVSWGIDQA